MPASITDRVIARIGREAGRLASRVVRPLRTAAFRASVAECGRVRVNGPVEVSGGSSVRVGDNCHFNGMIIQGAGGVTIGDNFHSGRGCRVFSANHDFDGGEAIPYGKGIVGKPVTIGDNVWLGECVLVMPGAVIGEGAVIAAGAVVTGEVEACAVAAGNPARVVKYRDREHYERMKAERRFH